MELWRNWAGFSPYFDMTGAYGNLTRRLILDKARAGMTDRVTKFKGAAAPALAILLFGAISACATVKVQAPDKPIEINMNINIKQEVLIKIDQEVADLIANNPDIF